MASGYWMPTRDGDPAVKAIFDRHYSRRHYRDGRRPKLFVGPGEKMVLLGMDGRAILIWRKFISNDGQQGVSCAVFRNEGDHTSSTILMSGEMLAWERWPGERLYSYVDPKAVRSSNPGYCFMMAGWRKCGRSKGGLLILEKRCIVSDYEQQSRYSQ